MLETRLKLNPAEVEDRNAELSVIVPLCFFCIYSCIVLLNDAFISFRICLLLMIQFTLVRYLIPFSQRTRNNQREGVL